MKILLLKPINDVYHVIQPSLGLGYIATILLNKGHDVQLVDSGRDKLTWKGFTEKITKEQYDLVGIQMFTREILSVKRHCEIIKKYSPHTKICLGGPHISGDPEGTMQLLPSIDFGFIGEAEIGIEKYVCNGDNPETVPNLVWRKGERVVVNRKEYIKNLDSIKFPAWQLMKPAGYPIAPHGSFCKRTPIAPLIISRGCPFLCTYCAGRLMTGKKIRYRSVKNVIEEIKLLYNSYGVREIHIEDDNFTLKKEYVIEFCKEISRLNLDIAFALPNGIRLDTLDKDVVTALEIAGFYSIGVGIESGSDRVLRLMKKH
ncbi:MAG: radical SAM protein, partial [Bacteroidota bacterium]